MSAITVAAVTAVAATAVSAYGASQQASAQKKAAGELNKGLDAAGQAGTAEQLYGKKFIPPKFQDTTSSDVFGDTNKGVAKSLPELFSIADQVNQKDRALRNKGTGGTFTKTQTQEGANILALDKGQVPQDVVDSINRLVAENLGGAFDPSGNTASQFGLSATASDTARRLGLTSLDLMKTGLQFGPAWRASVDAFTYKPQNAASDIYGPAAAMNLQAQNIKSQQDVNRYNSLVNIGKAEAGPDPMASGAKNDAILMAQLRGQSGLVNAQAQGNQTAALAGLINAGGGAITTGINAYNTYKTPSYSGGAVGAVGGLPASAGSTALNTPYY